MLSLLILTKGDSFSMRRFSGVLILVLLLVALAFAQVQVATVTSTSPFQLRGANVTPSQGVPSWPVMPGDKIKAGSAPVTVTFPDGSTITLAPGSEIKVTQSGATPVVTLLSGSASYTLKTLASVGLVADGAVTPTSLTGVLTLAGQKAAGGWWTTGHTILVVAGAGAIAGLGYGIVQATNGGTAVSPSQ